MILLTGATGYIGSQLLPLLVARGHRVRCLVIRPEALAAHAKADVEIAAGDVLDAASLRAACAGVETAYYLVHNMASPAISRSATAPPRGSSERPRARPACAAFATSRPGRQPHLPLRPSAQPP